VTTVVLPTHLRSYTAGVAEIDCGGATLGEVLAEMERRFPGFLIRVVDEQDRIRPHIKCFVAGEQAWSLDQPITGEVQIIAALSGG
jgi:hypothetical protein